MFGRKPQSTVIAEEVYQKTQQLLKEFNLELNLKFNELKSLIDENRLCIQDLERKLLSKDLKDRQLYGQLHYKIHEVRSADKKD
ncbi:MAG: hypothetical protein JNM93_02240 [Bacteriovoracaceae bacterium]|nr:hypothetical protein [Bacteriovoracaceae bacterium]